MPFAYRTEMILDLRAAVASATMHLTAVGASWAAGFPYGTSCPMPWGDPYGVQLFEAAPIPHASLLEVRMVGTPPAAPPYPLSRNCQATMHLDRPPALAIIRLPAWIRDGDLPGFCLDVDTAGRVAHLTVLKRGARWRGVAARLHRARLRPAMLDGHPVASRVAVTFARPVAFSTAS